MYCGRRALLTCRMTAALCCGGVEGPRGVLPAEAAEEAPLAAAGRFGTTCRQHDTLNASDAICSTA